jgi:hypothetical protein
MGKFFAMVSFKSPSVSFDIVCAVWSRCSKFETNVFTKFIFLSLFARVHFRDFETTRKQREREKKPKQIDEFGFFSIRDSSCACKVRVKCRVILNIFTLQTRKKKTPFYPHEQPPLKKGDMFTRNFYEFSHSR